MEGWMGIFFKLLKVWMSKKSSFSWNLPFPFPLSEVSIEYGMRSLVTHYGIHINVVSDWRPQKGMSI